MFCKQCGQRMKQIVIQKLKGKGLAIAGFIISIFDVVLVIAML